MGTLMVTGHRKLMPIGWKGNPWPDKSIEVLEFHKSIYKEVYRCCNIYYKNHIQMGLGSPKFITGMALGTDMIFAQAVIDMKSNGAKCTLLAAVPFIGQESLWGSRAIQAYRTILRKCDEVVYVGSPGFTTPKLQKRNEFMVDNSTEVLSIWDGVRRGGTWNCIKYAISKRKRIIHFDPTTFIYKELILSKVSSDNSIK